MKLNDNLERKEVLNDSIDNIDENLTESIENIDLENKEEPKEEKKPFSTKKTIIVIILVLLCTILMLYIVSRMSDLGEAFNLVRSVDGKYMSYAGIALALYVITYPLSLCIISRRNHLESRLFDDYFIGISEFFFSAVTPFSTGGQPVQIYLYTKRNVTAAKSTGVIMANFISMLFASNIIAIVSLFYYSRFSVNFNASTSWMIILGFVMNLFTLAFMICMATCKFIRDFFKKILVGISHWKFIGKFVEKGIPAFDKYCENAQIASREILSHKKTFILSIFVKGISLMFYYAIPYYILKSLGVALTVSDLPFVCLASAFAITTMVWVPTPGGTGGIEFAFTTIFTTFIADIATANTVATSGMLLWRFLTYYILMAFSFLCYILFNIIGKKKEKKNDTCTSSSEL